MRYLVLLIFCLLGVIPASAGQTLSFSMPDDEVAFVSLAILETAYAELGIKVVGIPMPAGRALAESDRGQSDGEVARIASVGESHPNLIRVTVPLTRIDGMAYACEPDIKVNGWNSLKGYRVGVRNGIQFAEMGTQDLSSVTKGPDYDVLFDLLLLKRLDVVIASRQVGFNQSKRMGADCLHAIEPPLTSLKLYHYLHFRNERLVPQITAVLQKMKDSGEMATIRERATRAYRTLSH